MTVDGVVLAGGRAARMGGRDKTAERVGGTTLLARAVRALLDGGADRVVVVGPRLPGTAELGEPPGARLLLTREDPPGSGPVAGLAAGLAALAASRARDDREPGSVVLLAADLARVDGGLVGGLVDALAAAPPTTDAVVAEDRDGRAQWLAASYRTGPLTAAVHEVLTAAGGARAPGLRDVVRRLVWTGAPRGTGWGRLGDVDTPEQLSRAHLDAWTVALAARWGLEPQLGDLLDDPERLVADVLDVAKDAAHTVARPAAPLTTFLLGAALAARTAVTDAGEEGTGTAAEALAVLRAELVDALREHGDGQPGR